MTEQAEAVVPLPEGTGSAWSGSVLFRSASESKRASASEPLCFADLNLDQITAALFRDREEYNLPPFFYETLHDVESVMYRQRALREIEEEATAGTIREFSGEMRTMRLRLMLADKSRDQHQREAWCLSAVRIYCAAVPQLEQRLREVRASSEALNGFASYLAKYVSSPEFKGLTEESEGLQAELDAVRYQVLVHDAKISVEPYEEASDLTAQIERTFEKFRQGAVEDHTFDFRARFDTNSVEQRILALVARVFPQQFAHAARFLEQRRHTFLDQTIARFDREVQFYFAYLEYIQPLREAGLEFSYPTVSVTRKEMRTNRSFDLALATKLHEAGQKVVCNDVELNGHERVIVVSGPNQGGKTTFARMFGQLHHLAALGLLIPGADTEVFLPDHVFTHFEREEDLTTLRGKFEDEIVRLHEILQVATDRSVLIMNESFSSTTLHDAQWVGERVLGRVIETGMLCLCVTFIDELASLDGSVVSMMSTVDPEDPAHRTFEVVRKPADGLAYAIALAKKHGVTYEQLKGRLAR